MTAPPALGLETPEQKAARLAAEAKTATLGAPALSLAQQASSTAANASQAVQAPTDLMTKTIASPATDRIALAQKAWDTETAQGAPAYEASLRSAKQAAAGVGQLGSGMLRTTLGDLSLQRSRDMDASYKTLMSDAVTGSISDKQFGTGVEQQQQGYQSAEDARKFRQALDSQKLGLDTTLGLGQLGVQQQQANTNATGTSGNLELQRADLVAKYGAAEADRMIEAQKVANQAEQAKGQLALATSAQTQQAGQFSQQMTLEQKKQELDQQVQTGQLTLAQSAQALAKWQAEQQATVASGQLSLAQSGQAQQQSQFTAAQSQQMTQFLAGMSLDEAKMALDKQVQTGQLTVQQAQQALAEKTQGGQLSLAQKSQADEQALAVQKQALDEKVRTGQLTVEQAAQELEKAKVAQQAGQFTASQAQQASQFGTTVSLDQQKIDLDRQVELGQLTVDQARQRLAEATQAEQAKQFGQSLTLEQLKANVDDRVRTGQLSVEQGQLALATKQQADQLSLAQGVAVGTVGGKETVESLAMKAQNDLAKNQLWKDLATILGLTPGGLTKTGDGGAGTPAPTAPGAPAVGTVVGAYVWNGTAWVPNVGGPGQGGNVIPT